jgi:RecB family endonuclease NucS
MLQPRGSGPKTLAAHYTLLHRRLGELTGGVEGLCLCTGIDGAHSLVVTALQRKRFTIIYGRCSVEYEGRGASRLGPGDRVVIVKPDGAVLVHRPTGYSPVNWQPDSKTISVEESQGGLVLRSVRSRPHETLTVLFHNVYAVLVLGEMEDTAEFIEYVDESEIRDYLYEHPEEIEQGLRPLAKEKPIGNGYADIYAVDSKGLPVVIEVKRVAAGPDAVRQLHRYVETLKKDSKTRVRGILAAPSITKEALALLTSLGLEFKQVNLQEIYRKTRAQARKRQTRGLLDFLAANRAVKNG